jgi:uncharacterized protein YqeY
MSLKGRIEEDMKAALRAGDKVRLSALRLALAAVKQREVDSRQALDDLGVLGVLERMIKQTRESLAQYREAGRQDLVEKDEAEIAVLQAYLPEPLTEEELDTLISDAIDEVGARGLNDIGKVMAAMKTKAAGRADMREVNARVRAALTEE